MHQDGFEQASTGRLLLLSQDLSGAGRRRHRHPERLEEGDDDVCVRVLLAALDIPIGRLNAVETGERRQIRTQAHASDPRIERIPRAGISTHVGRLFIS